MKYTRRDFIKFGSFAIGLIPGLTGQSFGQMASVTNASFFQTFASFQDLIGSQFTVHRENSVTVAILTAVKNFNFAQNKKRGECFSLVFEISGGDFGQGTYDVFHPSIGDFDLFLVPGNSQKGASLLVGVINRL